MYKLLILDKMEEFESHLVSKHIPYECPCDYDKQYTGILYIILNF